MFPMFRSWKMSRTRGSSAYRRRTARLSSVEWSSMTMSSSATPRCPRRPSMARARYRPELKVVMTKLTRGVIALTGGSDRTRPPSRCGPRGHAFSRARRMPGHAHVQSVHPVRVERLGDIADLERRGDAKPEVPVAGVRQRRVVEPEALVCRAPNERAGVRDVVAERQVGELGQATADVVGGPWLDQPERRTVLVHVRLCRIDEADGGVGVEDRDLALDRVGPPAPGVGADDPAEPAPGPGGPLGSAAYVPL